jgi:hypothetical protein
MENIRRAEPGDLSRIAEILVFTKRMKYRSIFHNDDYSFNELQVVKLAATALGRPLYESIGFTDSTECMVLTKK